MNQPTLGQPLLHLSSCPHAWTTPPSQHGVSYEVTRKNASLASLTSTGKKDTGLLWTTGMIKGGWHL